MGVPQGAWSSTLVNIDPLSLIPVFLEMFDTGASRLATGTGFVTIANHRPILLTARHNFTGKDEDGKPLDPKTNGIPRRLVAYQRDAADPLVTRPTEYALLNDHEEQLWLDINGPGGKVLDIAALPLKTDSEFAYVTDLEDRVVTFRGSANPDAHRLRLSTGEQVSVIGFPFGYRSMHDLPVWATGTTASEPDVDHTEGTFLIDCRSRKGQSGSPVFAKRFVNMPLEGENQDFVQPGLVAHCFLGLYTGRLRQDSDIGIVYRPSKLRALVRTFEEHIVS